MSEERDPLHRFLAIAGVDERSIAALSEDARLVHDLGAVGDSLLEAFEYLHDVVGVNFEGFDPSRFIPAEVSNAALVMGTRFLRNSALGRSYGAMFEPITLGGVRSAIEAKTWRSMHL